MSTFTYIHPADPNLNRLQNSMGYSWDGKPLLRTVVTNDAENPIPVSLGGNDVVITGNVTIPGTVNVASSPSDPVHVHVSEIGTSGVLDVPWMPVAGNVHIDGGNVNVVVRSGNVTVQQGTNPWVVAGNINVSNQNSNVTISNLGNTSIQTSPADGAQLGPFNRLRVANSTNINEYKNIYGTTTDWDFETITGGSGTTSFNANASTSGLSVGATDGDYVIRQTREYHTYTPGCGQVILATGVMAVTKPNLTQRIGYFDDRNGIFFERATDAGNATVNTWNIRNFNGGTATTAESAAQGAWNIDNFDGSGPSGIDLQWDRAQIWFIDFQWLGVGRVRCGFVVDGLILYAHEFLNTNSVTSTYMSQPTLPVRYEIRNTGTTSGISTMTQICSSVQTEGGTNENIWRFSVTTDGTGTVCGTTERGVIAIRLKNEINGQPNRSKARLADYTLFGTQTASYRILLCSNSTVISGSPTWTSVDATSNVEYATDLTLQNLSGNAICINSGFISTAQGSANGSVFSIVSGSKSSINQNYSSTNSQIIILTGQRIGNQDSTIHAALNWLELE